MTNCKRPTWIWTADCAWSVCHRRWGLSDGERIGWLSRIRTPFTTDRDLQLNRKKIRQVTEISQFESRRVSWSLFPFGNISRFFLWGHCQEYKIEKKAIQQECLLSEKKKRFCLLQPYLVWKFLSHWSRKTSPKVRGTLKSLPNSSQRKVIRKNAYKAPNRKVCCFLRCFSSSPGLWKTSKLPQEGRVLSDQKIDLQTTLSSRSLLESSAGKPFTSSSANQTPRQELRTTPLQGARMHMEGSATSECQNNTFFYRTKVLKVCMHAKNGGAGVTITKKIKVGVHPSRYRSKSIDGLTKGSKKKKRKRAFGQSQARSCIDILLWQGNKAGEVLQSLTWLQMGSKGKGKETHRGRREIEA